jgi:hypothetical protein
LGDDTSAEDFTGESPVKSLIRLVAVAIVAFVTPSTRGVEQAEVDKAIERGVKALQGANGDAFVGSRKGMTALAAVTLLECDVPPTDKGIQKAAEFVRNEVMGSDEVYIISTAIFFLDRLGDPIDEPLLQALTVRLLSGQLDTGAWTYNTAPIPAGEQNRLQEHYKLAKEKKVEPKRAVTARDLPPELQSRLLQIRPMASLTYGQGDHSNTQFAILATWVGRRHGVPVDGALARIDAHFRKTQCLDGGWGYSADTTGSDFVTTPAMTCAGVLGLSVAHGMVLMTGKALGPEARPVLDPERDLNLRAALGRIARNVGDPPSVKKVPIPKLTGNDIYFLWSLERIMVAMDLEKIGKKDWFGWGAEILIANQQGDGRWSAGYGAEGADTCFALLFLRKANLAGDLTDLLRKAGKFVLKAGPNEKDPKVPDDPKKPNPGETKPPPETRPTFTQPQSARLADSLVKAPSTKQEAILKELREGKGAEYTEALAGAIPQLRGDDQRKAREALAERLARMTAASLGRYLQDDDTEIRRAAALASGTREFKDQVPQLIGLLSDPDQGVVLAAHTALKAMTGEKFAPSAEPWRVWWKQQAKKHP